MFRLFRRDREKGAVLVEFAVIMPIFILLVFGIMESGWFFAQQVEVRNAAREGARLAVVDFDTQTNIAAETCSRADLSNASGVIVIVPSSTRDTNITPPDIGNPESVSVTMTVTYQSLTGILDFFDGEIASTAVMRTERPLPQVGFDSDGELPCNP